MADAIVSVYVGKDRAHEGEVVNVYGSYANALAHAATGLSTIKTLDKLDGTGDALTQEAKVTGVAVDQFGYVNFVTDTAETAVYLIAKGHWGCPVKAVVVVD